MKNILKHILLYLFPILNGLLIPYTYAYLGVQNLYEGVPMNSFLVILYWVLQAILFTLFLSAFYLDNRKIKTVHIIIAIIELIAITIVVNVTDMKYTIISMVGLNYYKDLLIIFFQVFMMLFVKKEKDK